MRARRHRGLLGPRPAPKANEDSFMFGLWAGWGLYVATRSRAAAGARMRDAIARRWRRRLVVCRPFEARSGPADHSPFNQPTSDIDRIVLRPMFQGRKRPVEDFL